jgi:cytochrome c-type biogenesis protein CcmF
VLSFTLLYTRWPELEAEVQLESMVSREAAFLFNNLLLVGIAFSVLWGTLFPILSEAVRGTKITVGAPFFNRVNVPLGLLLLGLTGIGPLIAWRKASIANLRRQFVAPVISGAATVVALIAAGMRDPYPLVALGLAGFVAGTIVQEFYRGVRARRRMHRESTPMAFFRLIERNRRRYGGYIVHVGILIYFVAFAGMVFKVQQEVTLKPGQSVDIRSPFGHRYHFTHVGISQYEQLNRIVSAATVEVTMDGKPAGLLTSEKRQHVDSFKRPTFEPSTEVGIRSGLQEDLYLVFAGSVEGTEEAVYRFNINPLVWWVWFGGFVLAFGGIVTMWPGGGPTVTARRPSQAGYSVELAGK